MAAQDEESATPRVEIVLVRSLSAVPASHAVLADSSPRRLQTIPLRSLGHSPPPSPPTILRI
jgi:hypothetical protein